MIKLSKKILDGDGVGELQNKVHTAMLEDMISYTLAKPDKSFDHHADTAELEKKKKEFVKPLGAFQGKKDLKNIEEIIKSAVSSVMGRGI